MPTSLPHLLLILACAALPEFTHAQIVPVESQVRVVPKISNLAEAKHVREYGHIEISGDIRQSVVAQLAAAFPQARRTAGSFTHSGEPVVRVFINSRGGEVLAAVRIGQIIRSQAAEVWVDKGAECSSACILVLAAGVSRVAVPGAKLGIHRPYFPPAEFAGLSYEKSQTRYAALSGGVKEYLAKMGIADGLHEAMLAIPSQKIEYLEQSFSESTRLLGEDPAYQEWQRAKDQKALGKERHQSLEHYTDCVNAGKSDRECEFHLSGLTQ